VYIIAGGSSVIWSRSDSSREKKRNQKNASFGVDNMKNVTQKLLQDFWIQNEEREGRYDERWVTEIVFERKVRMTSKTVY
jgi:hypothetical protein